MAKKTSKKRKRKPAAKLRGRQIGFWVTSADADIIKGAAEASDSPSLSEFVRKAVKDAMARMPADAPAT